MNNDINGPAIVAHGGAGGSTAWQDGCRKAAEAGMQGLARGGEALQAVVAAVVVLEDDGRFNAGSGSELGLDGVTIEMDASVMDTRGRLGAVACIQNVKNPVLVARAIADTPHYLMAGDGALRLARALGHQPFYSVTDEARKNHVEMLARCVDLIDKDVDIGLIGVTRTAQAACSNRDMPHAVVCHG